MGCQAGAIELIRQAGIVERGAAHMSLFASGSPPFGCMCAAGSPSSYCPWKEEAQLLRGRIAAVLAESDAMREASMRRADRCLHELEAIRGNALTLRWAFRRE